ncbi:MAG: CaiB/BaiF CoA-transferase family protein [Candidatus Binatus sp.]|uniref:CaiB/BaiF CoA transferase family protein n=1 Tax=Candidatus Binatus sp. TaxID=2811406 RepID=UPI0027190D25|nr:CaiB/BaiF CoA-transferase family protein [Candidatus Binatus sp.]MDO8433592.1 CaiB/BaiF CoA-transferase family protein [Candidatus Binatus sp.]
MGPLKGIRVLDMSMVVSGPFCTMMLGDLGADIVKFEQPVGDVTRMPSGSDRGGMTIGILNWNRNKRAIMLDLKRDGAAEVLLKMAEQADVVIQNVRPGVVERLGVGYEAVAARNPKIVYCSIAGYGFEGPYVNKPAYDPIIQGMAGVMVSQRTQGRPRAVKNIIADKVTAMTAAISILAALNEAQRSGRGQHLTIAMIDAVAYYLMPDVASRHTYLPDQRGVPPSMNTLEPFQTADGYITIAPLTDKHWAGILGAVGHLEWFEGDEPRMERVKRSIKSLITLFPTKPSAYWLERIEAADVPCGPLNDFDSIWTDPQFTVNQTFFEYEHPAAGRVRAVRSPAKFSRTQPELWRHAPALGQHTDEILSDFGFSANEIAKLRADQVVR